MSLNKVQLIGRVGKISELISTDLGNDLCRIQVCTTESFYSNDEKKQKTNWLNVVVFNAAARMCVDRISKNDLIYIEGRLDHKTILENGGEEKHLYEIVSTSFRLLSKGEPSE